MRLSARIRHTARNAARLYAAGRVLANKSLSEARRQWVESALADRVKGA